MAKVGDRFIVCSLVPGVPNMAVIFIGMQETDCEDYPAFALYNLTEDIPGHSEHSTISRDTLEGNGYVFPNDAP
jgi:hypothetical protein